jgi:hypothetical protein
MDDKEKSLFENFADTVKHTFDVATDAAKKALEPEPLKPDEKIVVVPAADAVGTDFLAPMPPMIAVVKKKRREAKKPSAESPAKAAKKSKQAKKSAKKATKKTVKKTAKKVSKKKKAKTPSRVVKKKKKTKRG